MPLCCVLGALSVCLEAAEFAPSVSSGLKYIRDRSLQCMRILNYFQLLVFFPCSRLDILSPETQFFGLEHSLQEYAFKV